jgi:hypothetical protein
LPHTPNVTNPTNGGLTHLLTITPINPMCGQNPRHRQWSPLTIHRPPGGVIRVSAIKRPSKNTTVVDTQVK